MSASRSCSARRRIFPIIDAFVSNHGSAGIAVSRPIETGVIIASADMLLADLVASLKMRLDPYVSPINTKALREICLPKDHEIIGDLAPDQGWINVPPVLMDSVRKRNESAAIQPAGRPLVALGKPRTVSLPGGSERSD